MRQRQQYTINGAIVIAAEEFNASWLFGSFWAKPKRTAPDKNMDEDRALVIRTCPGRDPAGKLGWSLSSGGGQTI